MDIKKVLFFKPGAIGDFLHTLPALKAFKEKYPAAHVTVMISPGLDSLIQGTHIADSVSIFDKSEMKKSIKNLVGLGLHLRKERFDLFIDMQPSFRSSLLRRLAGAGHVLVYRKQKRAKPGEARMHAAQNFMETLKPAGIDTRAEEIELPVGRDDAAAVGRFLSKRGVSDKTLIALNCSVGAARPARNWFPERFAELADRLQSELNAAVVFVGGKEDRALVAGVMAAMKSKAVSAAGELSISQTAALLAQCSCLVSPDTGPLHLATAVKTPVIGLYGSTDPRRTGPLGKGNAVLIKGLVCAPCEQKQCPLGSRACMEAITVDDVFGAVARLRGK